jgi:hypothetical protein
MQLLIRLPDALIGRFKRNVSVRQSSKFIQRLLEEALPPEDGSDDDPLYQAALAIEKEPELAAEMAEWETATMTGSATAILGETPVGEGHDSGRRRDRGSARRHLVGEPRSASGKREP